MYFIFARIYRCIRICMYNYVSITYLYIRSVTFVMLCLNVRRCMFIDLNIFVYICTFLLYMYIREYMCIYVHEYKCQVYNRPCPTACTKTYKQTIFVPIYTYMQKPVDTHMYRNMSYIQICVNLFTRTTSNTHHLMCTIPNATLHVYEYMYISV